MLRLEFERRQRELSQRGLAAKTSPKVWESDICVAEKYGFMRPGQLERVKQALGYQGDAAELLEEVS